jgi:hypothetical protein
VDHTTLAGILGAHLVLCDVLVRYGTIARALLERHAIDPGA